MRTTLIQAAQTGLAWGVTLLVTLAVVLAGSGWIFGDYFLLRARVANICLNAPQACEAPKPTTPAASSTPAPHEKPQP